MIPPSITTKLPTISQREKRGHNESSTVSLWPLVNQGKLGFDKRAGNRSLLLLIKKPSGYSHKNSARAVQVAAFLLAYCLLRSVDLEQTERAFLCVLERKGMDFWINQE